MSAELLLARLVHVSALVAGAVAVGALATGLVSPSLYTNWVYTGEAFRLAFELAILIAAIKRDLDYWERISQGAALEERRRRPLTGRARLPTDAAESVTRPGRCARAPLSPRRSPGS